MPTITARVTKQEKKAAKLEKELKALKLQVVAHEKRIKELEKWKVKVTAWGTAQVIWSDEVTAMLRATNWASVVAAHPGGGGINPPQDPPDWPTG